MSVLLDALKKAALEKQKREGKEPQQNDNVGPSTSSGELSLVEDSGHIEKTNQDDSNTQEIHQQQKQESASSFISDSTEYLEENIPAEPANSETNSDIVQQEEAILQVDNELPENYLSENDPIEILVDIAPEDLEDASPATIFADTASEETDEEVREKSLDQESSVQENSVQESSDQERTNPNIINEDGSKPLATTETALELQDQKVNSTSFDTSENFDQHSDQHSTQQNMSDSELKALLSNVAIDDDLLNQIENKNEEVNDQRRISFQRLLDKNREQARKRKLRFIILYSIGVVVACLVVAAYLYYISNEVKSLQPFRPTSYVDLAEEENISESDASLNNMAVPAVESELSEIEEGDLESTHSVNVASEDTANKEAINTQVISKQEEIKNTKPENSSLAKSKAKLTDRSYSSYSSTTPIKSSITPTKVNTTNQVDSLVKPSSNIIAKGKDKVKPVAKHVNLGYAAYQQGDLKQAAQHYEQALVLDPNHRDALLGAAAVATTQQQYAEAIQFYQRRLSRNPGDDIALAGMLAITAIDGAKPEVLSQVNQLLSKHPNAAHLYFLKGSIFAQQKQWVAAQREFFSAWSIESKRADYTYNLAISLDHLRQYKEALRFYKMSLDLPAINITPQQLSQLQYRVQQLESLTSNGDVQ